MTQTKSKPTALPWPDDAIAYGFELRKECKGQRERIAYLEAREAHLERLNDLLRAELAAVKRGAPMLRRPTLASKGVQA